MSFDAWGILTIILSFCMSFSIGSNDAANGLATSYGSQALGLYKLIALGAVAEFIGAMFCSDKVAGTLSKKIIQDLPTLSEQNQIKMMFSVCLASFIFIMTSSFSGMPISGTHTVIGALLGAGIVATGFENLNWTKFGQIVASWFLSPALAAFITFLMMVYVSGLTMNTSKYSFRSRILFLQFISAICFVIVAWLITILTPLVYSLESDFIWWQIGFYLLPFIAGISTVRLMILIVAIFNAKHSKSFLTVIAYILLALFAPLSTEFIEKLAFDIRVTEEVVKEQGASDFDETFDQV